MVFYRFAPGSHSPRIWMSPNGDETLGHGRRLEMPEESWIKDAIQRLKIWLSRPLSQGQWDLPNKSHFKDTWNLLTSSLCGIGVSSLSARATPHLGYVFSSSWNPLAQIINHVFHYPQTEVLLATLIDIWIQILWLTLIIDFVHFLLSLLQIDEHSYHWNLMYLLSNLDDYR